MIPEALKDFHKTLSDAHEEGGGLADDEAGDVVEETLAGVPLDRFMANSKYRKLCQVVMDAREEDIRRAETLAEQMFVYWDHPHVTGKSRVATREHADKNNLTGGKPGLPFGHIARLEE